MATLFEITSVFKEALSRKYFSNSCIKTKILQLFITSIWQLCSESYMDLEKLTQESNLRSSKKYCCIFGNEVRKLISIYSLSLAWGGGFFS